MSLKRVAAALAIAGAGLVLPLSMPASADPDFIHELPDAACNGGTGNAPHNPVAQTHVPHDHGTAGNCMTMPATKGPNTTP